MQRIKQSKFMYIPRLIRPVQTEEYTLHSIYFISGWYMAKHNSYKGVFKDR